MSEMPQYMQRLKIAQHHNLKKCYLIPTSVIIFDG